ncbi:MAG: MASE1 domain-containing protein [Anaerolineaceae bacterium]|nr:MASE1 domain-containing protein [Anaerolineaceae bacterium]
MKNSVPPLINQTWFRAIVLGLAYFLTALLSSKISFQSASFPTLWLPSGLLVAILLLSPVTHWPAYLLSATLAGFTHSLFADQPVINSILLTATTALEASTGAWLTRRTEKDPGKFNAPRHVFSLILFSALTSTAISATLNTTALATILPGVSYGATWRLNWIRHMLGVVVAAPLLLTWANFRFSSLHKTNADQLIELVILITGLSVCSLYISVGTYSVNQQNYLVIPFLVWAAIRFGPRGTASAALIFTLITTWGTIYHLEGFAVNDATIDPTMQRLGIFLLINLITCFILTTLWEHSKQIQKAQNESESRYRLLVENQGEGMGVVDQNETFTFANLAAAQIFGIEPGKLVGRNLREFTSPQQFELICAQTTMRSENKRTTYDVEITQPGGRRCNLLVTATPQFDETGQFTGTFAVFHDQTQRKQVELTLRDSRARFQTLFDHSPIPIWEEDFSRIKRLIDGFRRDGVEDFREFFTNNPDHLRACEQLIRILDVNKAAMQVFDFTDKADFMAQVNKMVHRGPYDIILEEMIAIADGKTEFTMEGPNDLIDGVVRYHSVRWTVAPGYEQDYRRIIVSIMDVTERKQAEEKLRYLSTHDVLTGLYNRNFFEAEMERLQNSRIEPTNLMMVDVNGMKSTNDTFGHAAGDELLRRTAQVLKLSFRKEDIIARIGGDEFVVLFQGSIPLQESVSRVEECLNDHNHWYHGPALSLAIGTASGVKGSPLIELFKKADRLMYTEKMRTRKVKQDGSNGPG